MSLVMMILLMIIISSSYITIMIRTPLLVLLLVGAPTCTGSLWAGPSMASASTVIRSGW